MVKYFTIYVFIYVFNAFVVAGRAKLSIIRSITSTLGINESLEKGSIERKRYKMIHRLDPYFKEGIGGYVMKLGRKGTLT